MCVSCVLCVCIYIYLYLFHGRVCVYWFACYLGFTVVIVKKKKKDNEKENEKEERMWMFHVGKRNAEKRTIDH